MAWLEGSPRAHAGLEREKEASTGAGSECRQPGLRGVATSRTERGELILCQECSLPCSAALRALSTSAWVDLDPVQCLHRIGERTAHQVELTVDRGRGHRDQRTLDPAIDVVGRGILCPQIGDRVLAPLHQPEMVELR